MNIYKKKNRDKLMAEFGQVKNDTFDFERIESYFRRKDNSNCFQVLTDKTCNDLDFQELFMFIDRTNSKVGQQFLYNKLRTIPADLKDISLHEKIIARLTENADLRLSIQSHLAQLNENEAFYITALFQEEQLKPPTWFWTVRLLAFTSLMSLVMLFFNPYMAFVLLGVLIVNIGIHLWNKQNLYQYLVSIPQLLRLNRIARDLYKNELLSHLNPGLSQSLSILDKVRNRMSFFKFESKLQGDMEALFWAVLEFFKILFLLEPLLLFGVLRQLNDKRKAMEDVFEFVGLTDALISIASLREGLPCYCIPEMNAEPKTFLAKEVYHPLIPNCVRNDIQLDRKSILLTGSNMSGKTSFIRTVGINMITAMTLNTCFAKQFSAPRMSVFSAIRISDDLMNDKSYYFEEVLTIKEMVDQSKNGSPGLFLLDELFKGTNTVERISAGKAVLSALAASNNIVFVSTHDIELADLLNKEYELYHFSERVEHKTIDFDYTLKPGKLKNRNAIRILEINDYPAEIIKEAMEISRQMDTSLKIRL